MGFIRKDYRRVAEVHFEAGYVPPDRDIDEFAQALRSVGEPIFGMDASRISMARLLAYLFRGDRAVRDGDADRADLAAAHHGGGGGRVALARPPTSTFWGRRKAGWSRNTSPIMWGRRPSFARSVAHRAGPVAVRPAAAGAGRTGAAGSGEPGPDRAAQPLAGARPVRDDRVSAGAVIRAAHRADLTAGGPVRRHCAGPVRPRRDAEPALHRQPARRCRQAAPSCTVDRPWRRVPREGSRPTSSGEAEAVDAGRHAAARPDPPRSSRCRVALSGTGICCTTLPCASRTISSIRSASACAAPASRTVCPSEVHRHLGPRPPSPIQPPISPMPSVAMPACMRGHGRGRSCAPAVRSPENCASWLANSVDSITVQRSGFSASRSSERRRKVLKLAVIMVGAGSVRRDGGRGRGGGTRSPSRVSLSARQRRRSSPFRGPCIVWPGRPRHRRIVVRVQGSRGSPGRIAKGGAGAPVDPPCEMLTEGASSHGLDEFLGQEQRIMAARQSAVPALDRRWRGSSRAVLLGRSSATRPKLGRNRGEPPGRAARVACVRRARLRELRATKAASGAAAGVGPVTARSPRRVPPAPRRSGPEGRGAVCPDLSAVGANAAQRPPSR